MRPEPGDEVVRLRLRDDEVKIHSSYEIKRGVLESPSTFAVRLGDGRSVSALLKRYPPRTPFQLLIGNTPQFTGLTDGFRAGGGSGGSSEITLTGRDITAFFHDGMIQRDQGLNGATYLSLLEKAMDLTGMVHPFTGARPQILATNDDNRRQITGQRARSSSSKTVKDLLTESAGTRGAAYQVVRARAGERIFDLLRRHLESIGCFIWAANDGNLVIGRPDGDQRPMARIERLRGQRGANILPGATYEEDHSKRFTEVIVYGRHSGRKKARTHIKSSFEDEELIALGYDRPLVLTSEEATSFKHAEHVARCRLARGRREGFELTYPMAGHTTEGFDGGVVTWAPDTTVVVKDEEFGLDEIFWVQHCTDTRSPETQTVLKLLRPADLVFGED